MTFLFKFCKIMQKTEKAGFETPDSGSVGKELTERREVPAFNRVKIRSIRGKEKMFNHHDITRDAWNSLYAIPHWRKTGRYWDSCRKIRKKGNILPI